MTLGRPRRAALLIAIAASALASGCADDPEDRSLCTVYDDFLEVQADVAALDPTSATADGAADLAADAVDFTRRLREAEPDRYGEALDALEFALQDVQRTLESVPDDADYSTWAPLVDDSVEDATLAAERVQDLIDPSCRSDA